MVWILTTLAMGISNMAAVATHLKKKTATFNGEAIRNASGRIQTVWLPYLENMDAPEQLVKDLTYLAAFGEYALDKLLTDSSNSGTPPSQDPHRKRSAKPEGKDGLSKRKPGGQKGHKGHFLPHVSNPDETIDLAFDSKEIEKNGWTVSDQVEVRQVFNITFKRHVVEYRAQVCYDANGKRHVAPFPEGVNSYAQYGLETRALIAHLLIYQMVPFNRTALFLNDIFNLPISEGFIKTVSDRIYNFLYEKFLVWAMYQLLKSDVIYTDETPVNVAGKTAQAIIVTNGTTILVLAFKSKSIESIEDMGILPNYNGIVVSDCNPATLHFTNCTHALCGIHLIRDLKACIDKEGMHWAELFLNFTIALKDKVEEYGALSDEEFSKALKHYNLLITKGFNEVEDKKEMGMPVQKSSALLHRLIDKQKEYLLFAIDTRVAFDNMVSERGFRMIKIHLKISGCFKLLVNANQYCLIKSYVDTCKNYGIDSYNSILMSLEGKCPDFINFNCLDDEKLLDLIKSITSNNKKILYSNNSQSDNNSSSNDDPSSGNNSPFNDGQPSGDNSPSNDEQPSSNNSQSNDVKSCSNNSLSNDKSPLDDNISFDNTILDKKVVSFYTNGQTSNFESQTESVNRYMPYDNHVFKCNPEIKNIKTITNLNLDCNKSKRDNETSFFGLKNIGTSFFNIYSSVVSTVKYTGKKIISYMLPTKLCALICG